MKAMNQGQLSKSFDKIRAEYEANREKIGQLEAQQANLQKTLYRLNVHREGLEERNIPDYPTWLPFSSNGQRSS